MINGLRFFIAASTFALSSAGAQWLNYKTPGIPRLPDGKPNLSAPAPRTAWGTPDFSGIWSTDTKAVAEAGKAIKVQPWAAALSAERQENYGKDSPTVLCLPPGPLAGPHAGADMKIVQAPGLLLMLYDGMSYRSIFLDGRELPKDPNPSWMGYSVGRWDGDTLVVESVGFNGRDWLDGDGHPYTEALRMTWHVSRPDFGHLEMVRTLVDPGALTEPWIVSRKFVLDPDNEPLEYVCNENEKDRVHLVGKASDEKEVAVAPELLAKYAGTYRFTIPGTDLVVEVIFRADGDHLTMVSGARSGRMKATSDTQFSALNGTIFRFVSDDTGVVVHALMELAEGEARADRKP